MKSGLKIIALSLVLGLAAPVQISSAQESGDVHIRMAPPRMQHEMRGHRPDRTSVWVGGYHEYDPVANNYNWHAGKWDHAPSQGQRWVAPRYTRSHGEYHYTEGRWK